MAALAPEEENSVWKASVGYSTRLSSVVWSVVCRLSPDGWGEMAAETWKHHKSRASNQGRLLWETTQQKTKCELSFLLLYSVCVRSLNTVVDGQQKLHNDPEQYIVVNGCEVRVAPSFRFAKKTRTVFADDCWDKIGYNNSSPLSSLLLYTKTPSLPSCLPMATQLQSYLSPLRNCYAPPVQHVLTLQ